MQFSEKNLPLQPVTQAEFERFTEALELYFEKIDAGGNEEDLKNNLAQFFNHIFEGKNEVSSQGIKGGSGIDMVIYLGKTRKSKAGVHIEVKSPANTSEMISPDKLNRKAFHESVLYFLFDKIKNKNNESKYIVITNLEAFYIFDAQEFTRLFIRDNKSYSNEFEAWKNGQRNDVTTKHMYEFIAEKMTQSDKQISGYHIQLNEYRRHLHTLRDKPDDFEARNRLAQLCHIFSPQFLLKQIDTNDSNTLNKDFYHELLHIMGLKEVKEKGKKLIKRKPEAAREHASMLENTISEIRAERITSDEDEQFDIALELCLTWVNRILFLKLLESQLYQYNNENDDYKFLTHKKIQNYDQLKTLFFQVLAIQIQDREAHIKKQYNHIPYLNSSLFDPTPTERKTVQISGLKSHYQLSIHPKTQLQDRFADGKCPTLEYFLRFLDAYDFGAVGKQELIREERKPLINAAVLGLIFEKINGYKEGSFYTPGFVTMYMCRETIQRAVLQKINNQLDLNCPDFESLPMYITPDQKHAANDTINSLTLCDPAVGSGHFLVSALNEIIAVKAELGLLFYKEPDTKNSTKYKNTRKPFTGTVQVENDELSILDEKGLPFAYAFNEKDKPIPNLQKIQEMLFVEKQTIIENCLFGVDINPNSVKICQLRLWIELLKNAFYTEQSNYQHLETLPNIDINIKCGNSLISRFPLDENLNDVFKKQKYNIQTYKNTVAAYRATRDGDMKQQLQTFLDDIKDQFQTTLASRDPLRKRMSKLRGEILLLENPDLFTNGKPRKPNGIGKKKKELAELEQQKQDIESNKLYQDAFEWRFEFPEVLDANGEFVGFDLIIGNPPYIRQEEIKELKPHLEKRYATYQGTADIFVYFYELGLNNLNKDGIFSFITANKWMRADYGKNLRKWLKNKEIVKIIDFGDLPVFEEATTYPSIIIIKNQPPQTDTRACNVHTLDFKNLHKYIAKKGFNIKAKQLHDDSWILIEEKVFNLLEKIKDGKKTLGEYVDDKIFRGVLTGLNEAFVIDEKTKNRLIKADEKSAEIIKPFLAGRDIKRYRQPQPDKYLILFPKGITKSWFGDLSENKAFKQLKLKYPSICNFLNQFKNKAKIRLDKGDYWWELRACDYYEEFEKVKVVYPNICKRPEFSIDENSNYVNQRCYMISNGNKNLIGLLNSRLYYFLFENILPKLRGGFYEPSYKYFKDFPVVECSENQQLTQKVTQILTLKREDAQADTSTLEAEIDQMVYELYGLTKKEIKIIEAATK